LCCITLEILLIIVYIWNSSIGDVTIGMNTVFGLYVGTYSRQLISILKHRWVALLDTVVVMLFYPFSWNNSL